MTDSILLLFYRTLSKEKTKATGKATENSRFESQKFPPLCVKIPENSRYENTAYTSPV